MTKADLGPLALSAAEAVRHAAMGEIDQAHRLYIQIATLGEEPFFLAVCAWASVVAYADKRSPPKPDDRFVAFVEGPLDDTRERLDRAASFIAGVLNKDVEGVLALWRGFTIEERLDLGSDVFSVACAELSAITRRSV